MQVPEFITYVSFINNELYHPVAVARGLGWPAGRLAGRHSEAAPKHSLCYFSSVSE